MQIELNGRELELICVALEKRHDQIADIGEFITNKGAKLNNENYVLCRRLNVARLAATLKEASNA